MEIGPNTEMHSKIYLDKSSVYHPKFSGEHPFDFYPAPTAEASLFH